MEFLRYRVQWLAHKVKGNRRLIKELTKTLWTHKKPWELSIPAMLLLVEPLNKADQGDADRANASLWKYCWQQLTVELETSYRHAYRIASSLVRLEVSKPKRFRKISAEHPELGFLANYIRHVVNEDAASVKQEAFLQAYAKAPQALHDLFQHTPECLYNAFEGLDLSEPHLQHNQTFVNTLFADPGLRKLLAQSGVLNVLRLGKEADLASHSVGEQKLVEYHEQCSHIAQQLFYHASDFDEELVVAAIQAYTNTNRDVEFNRLVANANRPMWRMKNFLKRLLPRGLRSVLSSKLKWEPTVTCPRMKLTRRLSMSDLEIEPHGEVRDEKRALEPDSEEKDQREEAASGGLSAFDETIDFLVSTPLGQREGFEGNKTRHTLGEQSKASRVAVVKESFLGSPSSTKDSFMGSPSGANENTVSDSFAGSVKQEDSFEGSPSASSEDFSSLVRECSGRLPAVKRKLSFGEDASLIKNNQSHLNNFDDTYRNEGSTNYLALGDSLPSRYSFFNAASDGASVSDYANTGKRHLNGVNSLGKNKASSISDLEISAIDAIVFVEKNPPLQEDAEEGSASDEYETNEVSDADIKIDLLLL